MPPSPQRGRPFRDILSRKPLPLDLIKLSAANTERLARRHRNSTLRDISETKKHSLRVDSTKVRAKKPFHTARPTYIINKHIKNDRFNGEISKLSDSRPDFGIESTDIGGFGYPMLNPAKAMTTGHHFVPTMTFSPHVPTFSPLPPLLSMAFSTGHSESTGLRSSLLESLAGSVPSSPPTANLSQNSQGSHKVPTSLISLLGVGAACLILGLMIVVKMCTRPTRQPRPKPSLPILEKGYSDEDFYDTKESPVFGGKERGSSRPGSNALWAWVQYPQPVSKGSLDKTIVGESSMQEKISDYGAGLRSPRQQTKATFADDKTPVYTFSGQDQAQAQNNSINAAYKPQLQQVQSAISRAANRLSVASASVYLNTPQTPFIFGDAKNMTNFTADGHPVIKRSKSKTLRKSKSYSVLEDNGYRDSEYGDGLAYDGADVSSPIPESCVAIGNSTAPMNSIAGNPGRARIKSSYYAAGTYPRLSRVPSAYAITTATKVTLSRSNALAKEVKSTLRKSDSHRDRDTKALTFALGLTSPPTDYIMPSPQPTLYPDDSLSVVEPQRRKRNANGREAEEPPLLPLITPTKSMDGGSLMSMEFGVSNMSLSGLAVPLEAENRTELPSTATKSIGIAITGSKSVPYGITKENIRSMRCEDKAPRVPSPPALPSLKQMGLEHANPEAYANYRSPTYSIYGLYESERKSMFGR